MLKKTVHMNTGEWLW